MKPAVAFIAAFVLATVAATGTSAKLHPAPKPPPAPADSTASADSTQSDSTSADSSSSSAAGDDSTLASKIVDTAHVLSISPTGAASPTAPATQSTAARGATGGAAGGATVTPRPVAIPALPVAGAPRTIPASNSTQPDTASQHHLAKLFASMQPKEAAQVLQRMADDDVQIILGYVGTRQAAAILAELPPDRVATLSKLALRAGSGGRVK